MFDFGAVVVGPMFALGAFKMGRMFAFGAVVVGPMLEVRELVAGGFDGVAMVRPCCLPLATAVGKGGKTGSVESALMHSYHSRRSRLFAASRSALFPGKRLGSFEVLYSSVRDSAVMVKKYPPLVSWENRYSYKREDDGEEAICAPASEEIDSAIGRIYSVDVARIGLVDDCALSGEAALWGGEEGRHSKDLSDPLACQIFAGAVFAAVFAYRDNRLEFSF
ncbi:hypothetical protein K402DRAFT_408963 [Aulographum hederae CBS 113979]|uniref:Uncharacterized protein n=1 Tax=Aulographum hederae CBS 113979 TaxID=1176131 RepID=A0A6G1GIH4_9PEZI|nr:hypothetical protein K402DRAFT_408963 [Aulographum hederae CBS 113979]